MVDDGGGLGRVPLGRRIATVDDLAFPAGRQRLEELRRRLPTPTLSHHGLGRRRRCNVRLPGRLGRGRGRGRNGEDGDVRLVAAAATVPAARTTEFTLSLLFALLFVALFVALFIALFVHLFVTLFIAFIFLDLGDGGSGQFWKWCFGRGLGRRHGDVTSDSVFGHFPFCDVTL